MKKMAYWSKKTNPDTGAKFEAFYTYLKVAHNGGMDLDRFIQGAYGEEFARRLEIRFKLEDNAMGKEAMEYFNSLNLQKRLFDGNDYYERWSLFTPLNMKSGKKYPLVFSHHGGGSSIETDEFSSGYIRFAGKEGFMVAFLQNTNRENVNRVLDFIGENYPLDTGRIYISGFSQGGYQTHSAYFRNPEKFAAVAPCGNDIYRPWDNFDTPYTEAEEENLRRVLVPFFQMTGSVEASSFIPLTDWKPRKDWNDVGNPETFIDPRKNDDLDPTRMHDPSRGYRDPSRLRLKQGHSWSQCTPPSPPPGMDIHHWMMGRINRRMYLLGCERRDEERCLSYADTPEDALHHTIGIYGDKELTVSHFGAKHYSVDIWNKDGLNAFRYVTAENCPHWPYLMMGELAWNFFKQFRRDSKSGKIIEDTYENP
jgi:pimeloyl-ACP methyl ester carboxylesterase